jgi:hypothetical protein
MKFSERLARFLIPQEYQRLQSAIQAAESAITDAENRIEQGTRQRVAEIILKMDPFEPLMKKCNVIFSEEWEHPEDKLDSQSQLRLFMWAYGQKDDPSFNYLMSWIQNTQGNATIRKSTNEKEWFFGRACLAVMTLFVREVGRLSSHYEDLMRRREQSFDENLPV